MGEGEIKVEAIKEEFDSAVGMSVGSGGVPNRNSGRQYQGGNKGKGGGQRYGGGGVDNDTTGCKKCGNRRGHEPNYPCPAAKQQCNTCGKTGHYSKVCWHHASNQPAPNRSDQGNQSKTDGIASYGSLNRQRRKIQEMLPEPLEQ
eukprot:GHVR01069245.1.p1 GENE.GHVR01069245.1~~GHVR01069245.1.p1  ORF type:complete len:145 (-),score=24.69 GHVR01069245.1:53-487(-)